MRSAVAAICGLPILCQPTTPLALATLLGWHGRALPTV